MRQIDGLSFYHCESCDYHFAIEYPYFPDEISITSCAICGSEDFKFMTDMDGKELGL